MAMVVNHNIPALTTYNTVNATSSALAKSIAKLSTGLRINSAADDAAGLAISEKMRAQINGLNQAISNSQDGISLLQTAEGALSETHSILQRMRELSVQAANDTLTQQDRSYIQLEIDELRDEITNIGNTTQFNTKKLLNGDAAVLWSADKTSTKAIVNGGLRKIDDYGQKNSIEGNYKITINADPGKAQVQKSDIMKLKHNTTVASSEIDKDSKKFNTAARGFGIVDISGKDLENGSYSVSLTTKTDATNPYAATKQASKGLTGMYVQNEDFEKGNGGDVKAGTAGTGDLQINAAADNITKNANIALTVKKIEGNDVTFDVKANVMSLDGTVEEKNFDFKVTAGTASTTFAGKLGTGAGEIKLSNVDHFTEGDVFTYSLTPNANATVAADVFLTTKSTASADGERASAVYALKTGTAGLDVDSIAMTSYAVDSETGKLDESTVILDIDKDSFKLATIDAVKTDAIGYSYGDEVASFRVGAAPALVQTVKDGTLNANTDNNVTDVTVSGNVPGGASSVMAYNSLANAGGTAGGSIGSMYTQNSDFSFDKGDLDATTNELIITEDAAKLAGSGSVALTVKEVNTASNSVSFDFVTSVLDAATGALIETSGTIEVGATAKDYGIALGLTTAGDDDALNLGLNATNKEAHFTKGDVIVLNLTSDATIGSGDAFIATKNDGENVGPVYTVKAADVKGKDLSMTTYSVDDKGNLTSGTITITTDDTTAIAGAATGTELATFYYKNNAAVAETPGENQGPGGQIGDVATSKNSIRDVDKFWNTEGKFMVTDPQTITINQGDGKKASVTIYGTDTLGDVATKLNDAIADQLGQRAYVDDPTKFVVFVDEATEDPTTESVKGTFVISSALAGVAGELSFAGDENLINAFSLNEIQKSSESTYKVDVENAHTGEKIAEGVKITGNKLVGVVNENVDVEFDPMAGLTATWNDTTKEYKLSAQEYVTTLHLADNTTVFQVGANEGEDMAVHIGDMRSQALGLNKVNVTNRQSAARSITVIDNAIDKVSTQRAKIGAYQNRLEHKITNLTTSYENLSSAESRIRDTDMAKEMMNFMKLQISSQAGTSMLAQANQLTQNVLSLIR